MPQALSDLERRALDYIVEYLRENTFQPSVREIGRRFGLKSTKTVSELLHSIETKGYIERDPSRSRAVRVVGLTLRSGCVSVPVLGRDGRAVDRFELDRRFTGPAGAYFLQQTGDELKAEGIREGDLALVDPSGRATSGEDLVVVEGEDGGPGRVARAADTGRRAVLGRVIGVVRRLGQADEAMTPATDGR